MWVSATVKSLQKKRSKGDIVDFSVWHYTDILLSFDVPVLFHSRFAGHLRFDWCLVIMLEAQISVKNKPSTDDVAVEDILAVLLTYGQVGQSPTGPVCAQNISWGQLGDIASTNTDSRRFSLPSVTKYPIHNCPHNYATYKDPVLDLSLFFYHFRGMQFLEHPTSIRTSDSVAQMLLKHIQPNFETYWPQESPSQPAWVQSLGKMLIPSHVQSIDPQKHCEHPNSCKHPQLTSLEKSV